MVGVKPSPVLSIASLLSFQFSCLIDASGERDKTDLARMKARTELDQSSDIRLDVQEVLTGPGMLVTMVDSVSVLLLYKLLLTKNRTICLQRRAGNHEWTYHHHA